MKRTTLTLIFALSLTFLTYGRVVHAECTVNGAVTGTPETSSSSGVGGTAGNDTIICDDKPVTITRIETGTEDTVISDVGGSNGSDTIVIQEGSTVWNVAGDGTISYGALTPGDHSVSPVSNPDTIIIAGTANNVYGDLSTYFDGADDTITVTSTGHVSNIAGDSKAPSPIDAMQQGNDTITVESGGVVDNDVVGDNLGTPDNLDTGGDDTITVNGTVGGNVDGQLGDDTIVVGGTVGGTVNGGIGDDSVTLNEGANGGADNNLVVNGGSGSDTLTFAFNITSEVDYNALANLIAANTPSGSITINGQTITWSNFEQLVNALIANFSVGSKVTFKDNRINQGDAGASALAYCTGSGVQVLGVNSTTAQGSEAFTVSTMQIQTALAAAQSSNTNINIANGAGINLAITPDAKLVVTAPDISDAAKTYQFSFDASVCGIS